MVEKRMKPYEMAEVKSEVDNNNSVDELFQLGRVTKRPKLESSQQGRDIEQETEGAESGYDPLSEPSPLGLRLKKSPSLLELIQMKLSQQRRQEKATKSSSKSTSDKIKASNFPASLLRIGTWEYKSRHEGDLVAKCYFAKHKLVWEVLDGALKNKIEIQWSDILAIKANYAVEGMDTLDVVLTRQPLFFRETTPQPRKHTLWQPTADFTEGQASTYRCHFLECPQGLLGRHFQKLIQCDPRLNFLSQLPQIVLDSPHFEHKVAMLHDTGRYPGHSGLDSDSESLLGASPSRTHSSSSKNEPHDFLNAPSNTNPWQTSSPSSVIDTHAIEETGSGGDREVLSSMQQVKEPIHQPPFASSNLVCHTRHSISELRTFNHALLSDEKVQNEAAFRQYLPTTSLLRTTPLDEQSLVSRETPNLIQGHFEKHCANIQAPLTRRDDGEMTVLREKGDTSARSLNYADGSQETSQELKARHDGEPGGDTVVELLVNLPRIASFPQFLHKLPEDSQSQTR